MNQSIAHKDLLSISLAIFCMLFGAGNLIYPLTVGKIAGNLSSFGLIGFFITAIFLPLAGLVSMILFDGNYKSFFHRLGKPIGEVIIFICMLIIGPIIVIPRCITLSHTMITPFIPMKFLQEINPLSSLVFCILFLSITFLATYRRSRIVAILGNVIAPILLASITLIIGKGLATAETSITTTTTPLTIFKTGFMMGYQTLDLLGTLFFASIIISILKKTTHKKDNLHALALYGFKAGLIGLSLLGCVYIGMSMLGAFHSHSFMSVDSGELFRLISFSILGTYGAAIISISVLLACISTVIGLGAVVAEYLKVTIFHNAITYVQALLITFLSCIPLSIFGLKYVLAITGGPIVYIGYPLLITLTFCNIAYKLWGFEPVKAPTLITLCIALMSYFIQ
jgi:LIVCS family branched-chain amino acid:cation transporter